MEFKISTFSFKGGNLKKITTCFWRGTCRGDRFLKNSFWMFWEESALIRLHISKLHRGRSFGHRSKERKRSLQCIWQSISIIFSTLKSVISCILADELKHKFTLTSIFSCWHSGLETSTRDLFTWSPIMGCLSYKQDNKLYSLLASLGQHFWISCSELTTLVSFCWRAKERQRIQQENFIF